jgi:hypothetical protein
MIALSVLCGCGRVGYSSVGDDGGDAGALSFDASPPDGRVADSSALDSSSLDSGSFDSGSFDSGSFDSGSFDSGSLDGGELVPDPTLTPTWELRATAGGPPAGVWTAATYDERRARVVVYGGRTGEATAVFASHWEWDGATWSRVCDPCAPGGRFGSVLIYDPVGDRLVLFGGGTTISEIAVNDVWEWDEAGGWRPLTTSGVGPSERIGPYGAYDPDRRTMMIFAGERFGSHYDDVWELDLATDTWAGPFMPALRPTARSSRCNAATYVPGSALDPALRRRTVIYSRDNGVDDSLWAWDGAARTWTALCASCTGRPRTHAPLRYDPRSGRLVVVGGYVEGMVFDGTWEGDSTALGLRSSDPPSRDDSTLTYDRARSELVLYGGNGSGCAAHPGSDCPETWIYAAP